MIVFNKIYNSLMALSGLKRNAEDAKKVKEEIKNKFSAKLENDLIFSFFFAIGKTITGTTIKDALKMWEKQTVALGEDSSKEVVPDGDAEEAPTRSAADAKELDLQFCWPPIEVMDKTLGTLTKCKKLFLSTNLIEKIQGLHGMENLRVLSLSRNSVKSLQGIEAVADSLEELWLSYNYIVSLKGINVMGKLRVLYVNFNYIRDWNEIARLGEMPKVADVAFLGNPVHEHSNSEDEYRNNVFKRIPQLRRLDGEFRTYG